VAMDSASVLIGLRAFAFWRRNYYVLAVMVCVFLVNAGVQIHDIVLANATWDLTSSTCTLKRTERMRMQLITTFSTDVCFLTFMLVGLIMQRYSGGLYKILFYQGLLWTVIATLAYIPPVLLNCLNLNDIMNVMTPSLAYVTLVICATRMHRALAEHVNSAEEEPSIFLSSMRFPSMAVTSQPVVARKDIEATTTTDSIHLAHSAITTRRDFFPEQ